MPASETSAERRAIGQPRKQVRAHDRGIMLVIGDERRRDAVMGEQRFRDPRILGDDRIGGGERGERAERNIAEVADRRRDDMEPLRIGSASARRPNAVKAPEGPCRARSKFVSALPIEV